MATLLTLFNEKMFKPSAVYQYYIDYSELHETASASIQVC